MEQRQPDELNEPRPDPSPQQPSESNNTAPSPADQPSTDNQATDPRGDGPLRLAPSSDRNGGPAPQNPNQRENRQQNGRNKGGQRGDRPNDGSRNGGRGPRTDRNGGESSRLEPGADGTAEPEGKTESTEQNGNPAPQGDGQRNRGQRSDNQRSNRNAGTPPRNDRDAGPGPREDRDGGSGQRGDRDGGDAAFRPGPRNNRSENRPGSRDRSTGTRERSLDNRIRDDRYRAGDQDNETDRRDGDGQDNQTAEFQGRDDRLVIGISLGDYNGIGPEVILKALQNNRLQKLCTPVIYGSIRILNRYRNLLDMKDWTLNGIPDVGQISHKLTNVITCWPDQDQDIQPGQVTPEAGQAALASLQRAVDDLKAGQLDALVTAPINKYNIQSEEFQFPGHTEYLAQQFEVADNLMFMVSDILRVGVVTGHVPLGRVSQNITRERIAQKLALMMQSLKQDFGIEKPKIAVLGLNPHAGEEGLLGSEEQDIVKPLLTDLRNKGQLVFGPYPADGFFGTRNYRNFDAVLAMYHDQGLIPFKAIAFEEGVNFTAGMPVVRTSPDHGTAYDIAGKDLADETSMLQAIYTAIDVTRQRKEFMELEAGALRKQASTK